ILASNGKRVLMVDWDLEAPWVHRYFRPFLVDKDLVATEGLIDLMWDFVDAAMTPEPEPKPEAERAEGERAPTESAKDWRAKGWHEAYADLSPFTAAIRWRFP